MACWHHDLHVAMDVNMPAALPTGTALATGTGLLQAMTVNNEIEACGRRMHHLGDFLARAARFHKLLDLLKLFRCPLATFPTRLPHHMTMPHHHSAQGDWLHMIDPLDRFHRFTCEIPRDDLRLNLWCVLVQKLSGVVPQRYSTGL